MARKRAIKKEEEKEKKDDKPSFVPPKFDETEFLQTENRSAKMIYISLGVSLVMGIASYLLMHLLFKMEVESYKTIPIAVPVLGFGIVIYIFTRFGIDVKTLDWKKWLENSFMYGAAWFGIFVISMNPPFSDFSEPVIGDFIVGVDHLSSNETVFYNSSQDMDGVMPSFKDVRNVILYVLVSDDGDMGDVNFSVMEVGNSSRDREIRVGENHDPAVNLSHGLVAEEKEFMAGWKKDDQIPDSWFGSSFDRWDGRLWFIELEGIDLSSGDLTFRVEVTAKDDSGNIVRLEPPFEFKVKS